MRCERIYSLSISRTPNIYLFFHYAQYSHSKWSSSKSRNNQQIIMKHIVVPNIICYMYYDTHELLCRKATVNSVRKKWLTEPFYPVADDIRTGSRDTMIFTVVTNLAIC